MGACSSCPFPGSIPPGRTGGPSRGDEPAEKPPSPASPETAGGGGQADQEPSMGLGPSHLWIMFMSPPVPWVVGLWPPLPARLCTSPPPPQSLHFSGDSNCRQMQRLPRRAVHCSKCFIPQTHSTLTAALCVRTAEEREAEMPPLGPATRLVPAAFSLQTQVV